jgi:hypothetical protein
MVNECDPPGFLANRLYLSFVDPSKNDEMFQRLLVRIGISVTSPSSSTQELLELHREFLEYSGGILYFTTALTLVGGITLLVAMIGLSALFGALIPMLCALFGMDSPQWLNAVCFVVGSILAFLFVGWPTERLNSVIEKVRDCERRIYWNLYLAPKLARIASGRGIDKPLAIQAYESVNGTIGIEVFGRTFDAARSRNRR